MGSNLSDHRWRYRWGGTVSRDSRVAYCTPQGSQGRHTKSIRSTQYFYKSSSLSSHIKLLFGLRIYRCTVLQHFVGLRWIIRPSLCCWSSFGVPFSRNIFSNAVPLFIVAYLGWYLNHYRLLANKACPTTAVGKMQFCPSLPYYFFLYQRNTIRIHVEA
jgi:hypothetical protein